MANKRVDTVPGGARIGQRLRIDTGSGTAHGLLCDVLSLGEVKGEYRVKALPPGAPAFEVSLSGRNLRTVRGKPLAPGHDNRRRQEGEKRVAEEVREEGRTLAAGEPCPACMGGMLEKRTARLTGELHLGCDRYPSCTFTTPLADAKPSTTHHAKPDNNATFGASVMGDASTTADAADDDDDAEGYESVFVNSDEEGFDLPPSQEGPDAAEQAAWEDGDEEEAEHEDDAPAPAHERPEKPAKPSKPQRPNPRAEQAAQTATAAAKALQEAVRQMQEASAPDEDRIREIAREEAGKLDTALVEDIMGEVEVGLEGFREKVDAKLAKLAEMGGGSTTLVLRRPDDSTVEVKDAHVALPALLDAAGILAPRNLYVAGPAGSGKTTLAHAVATALGIPFALTSLSGGATEGDLLGRTTPNLHDGARYYTPSPFVSRYREGGVILLDEIDGADANVLLALNAALANGHMTLPNGERVERHPDCVVIVAANTFGNGAGQMYVGRAQLDAAFLDRFAGGVFFVDYDRAVEARIAGCTVAKPTPWLARLWKMREAVQAKRLRRVLSTRAVIAVARYTAAGKSADDALRRVVTAWSHEDLATVGESALATTGGR